MILVPKLGSFEPDFEFNQRFRLASFTNIFSKESYASIQQGFDTLAWEKKETHFYQQFSSKIEPEMDHPFSGFYQASFFNSFKSRLEPFLGVRLRDCFSMVAHKLVTSQEIGVHNDYCDPEMGYENFRFIFQFARQNQLKGGGELSFLFSEDKQDILRKYDYSPNQGICFEITPFSHHFVAAVDGERHTLVMYLWDACKKYDGSGFGVIREK